MIGKKKLWCIVIYALLTIAILAVVMPIIIGAGFTYPCEDDFSFEMGGKVLEASYGNFFGALYGTMSYYMNWEGTYFSNFLWYFVRPYDRGGLFGVHFVMIALSTLLILAIAFMIKTLIKEHTSVLVLILVVCIIFFNTSRLGLEKEFLYWYTAGMNYALTTALACITLALAVRLKNEDIKKRKNGLAIAGSITGFLASGGTLEVASFNCSWLLLMLILCYKEIPKKKIMVLPFTASFVGALINACSPGNFVRSAATSNGLTYSVFDALKDTLICWKTEWNDIFSNKFFAVLLVAAFIACLLCKTQVFSRGISTGKMLLLIPASFFIQFFTAFPVVLGYHSSKLTYGRTIYTYELLTKLMLLFLVISFAQWLREHLKLSVFIPAGIALVIGVFLIANNHIVDHVKQGFSYNVAKELHEGTIQELYEFRVKILTLLSQCEKNTDVCLKVPGVPASNVMYGMGITTDPYCICNSHAAAYFEFKSLLIEYSDEYEFPHDMKSNSAYSG